MPEIRRPARPWAPIGLLCAAVLACGALPVVALAKSLPPVSLMWQVDSTGDGEGTYDVALTVSARTAFSDLAVQIQLPPGVALTGGDTRWNGPLAAGEAHTVSLTVHTARPREVHAKIWGTTASNVHFSRAVSVHVPEPNHKKSAPDRPERADDGPTPGIREYRSP